MVTDQTAITQTFAQAAVETLKAAVQAIAVAVNEGSSRARRNTASTEPKIHGPTLRQPAFDWGLADKYTELRNFRLEVNNILQSYNVNNTERIAVIKNWLGRQGLKLIEIFTQAVQELCNTVDGLFDTVSKKFYLQHNKMTKSLQYCKLSRQSGANTEEWMGSFRIAAENAIINN